MSGFVDRQMSRVPPGMSVPDEVVRLFGWIEEQGFVSRGRHEPDEMYGELYDEHTGQAGTWLRVHAENEEMAALTAESWLEESHELFRRHVWPFASSAEGSMVAVWRAPDDSARIVHLGSGSGSLLTCQLEAVPVDLPRLLAIGYDEICWHEQWDRPPDGPVNQELRDWVAATFGVTASATGLEVVPHPAEMGDQDTADPFPGWLVGTGMIAS